MKSFVVHIVECLMSHSVNPDYSNIPKCVKRKNNFRECESRVTRQSECPGGERALGVGSFRLPLIVDGTFDFVVAIFELLLLDPFETLLSFLVSVTHHFT
jgi:hypothetical protein